LEALMSTKRLQFDFSTEALKKLDDIKEKTDASTRAETVREALRLYEWLVNEVDPDYTVKIYNKSNKLLTAFKAKLLFK
jgi:metal-responsive CopG/Arc/MetJ family transcriptional regulator